LQRTAPKISWPYDWMDEHRKIEAIAAARREIARRIARVCTSLSPEEFDKLLDRMAGIQWKYEIAFSESTPPDVARSLDRSRDWNTLS
jgi:hypothetical protein